MFELIVSRLGKAMGFAIAILALAAASRAGYVDKDAAQVVINTLIILSVVLITRGSLGCAPKRRES